MEQPSSSSKVTVEYFDPSGVFQLLSPGLLPRLPLHNLHWESHAGPLRSIQTLHVDLVPSAEARSPSSASNLDLSRVKSSESTGSGDDGFRTQTLGNPSVEKERPDSRTGFSKGGGPVKGRRHQIPGLRQTPYLKVFFLRCDDSETYKAHTRKQVREWIKEHTPPAQSNQKVSPQENHDAFEWLILHVIVPNTAAATQPRISAKGSTSILEKLRADFNGTSKSAVDRVAQIRIGVNDVPYDLLPRVIPAIPGSYAESPSDHEESWQDLILKFKSLILASFDMRVSQYEEDIKEKDAQRALPGWNFCTFFVLKEGLARGFESVGLVEDALVGYDELSVGLDTIIREQAVKGSGAEHGGSFLPYTEDLKLQVARSRAALLKESGLLSDDADGPIDLQNTDQTRVGDTDEIPLIASKKQYRELILANNISVFDFRCYLFGRQLSLLLRMGNASSSREELLARLKELRESSLQGVAARRPPSQPSEDAENLAILSDICERSLLFVASISRIMRDDLLASSPSVEEESGEDLFTIQVIDNVVSSFTFSVAQQILAQTSSRSLPIPPSTLAPISSSLSPLGQEQKAAIPEPKTMMHPARTTSLVMNSSSNGGPQSPGIFPGVVSEQTAATAHSIFLKAGLEALAAHRAELYGLSRTVLERLGAQRLWLVGWDTVSMFQKVHSKMEDIDLSDSDSSSATKKEQLIPSLHGLNNKLLRTALDNKDDFYRLYETLTDKSLRHYTVAGHIQSVQSTMTELALLNYHLLDYAAAAAYFYRMTPFYGEGGWEEIELAMLVMYTKCLKELKRNDEYVLVALKLLAKGAAEEKKRIARNVQPRTNLDLDEQITVDGYLDELMTVVPTLQHDVPVQLQSFFSSIEVEGTARYQDGKDTFALQLKLRYLLKDSLNVEKARVLMVPITGGQNRDIWLETEGPTVISNGVARLQAYSNVIIPGTYTVKQVVLFSSKMILSYEHDPAPQSHIATSAPKFFKCPPILLYQRPSAFDIKLFTCRYMHLERNRFLEIELSAGWNDVQSGELHVRAATAGLRLQTSEIQIASGTLDVNRKSDPGVIRFGALGAQSKVKIRMPFTLEREVIDLSIKLEISYTTKDGTFFYASNPTISIMLPLGVNVQDVFKHNALFSKFSISSATPSPLHLLSSKLDDSDVFDATKGAELASPVLIFPRQSASLLYKITRRSTPLDPAASGRKKPKAPLSLTVNYICLEEELDNAVTAELEEALLNSQFYQYSCLVIPTVLSQLRSRMTPQDLERTALLGELSTSLLSYATWREHFVGLGQNEEQNMDTAELLAQWLQAFLDQRPNIALLQLTTSEETVAQSRSIIIPVEVPSITIVHTADLKINRKGKSGENVVAVTNEPIAASLQIKHTRIWDTKSDATLEKNIEFVYELSVAPDTWLIGGKRKGHFRWPSSTTEGKSKALDFPVLLIPMKEGYLPYPILEIKPVPLAKSPPVEGHTGTGSPKQIVGKEKEIDFRKLVTCETDYKNVGEVIRVISNARKTTVSLDASGPQGGAWLLESEQRGEDVFVR